MPVPGNIADKVHAGVFVIACAGEDRGSVLGEFVQIRRNRDIEQLQCFHDAALSLKIRRIVIIFVTII
ncbi:hypothetical protein SDC9_142396 [bioreactor metagenome]|uniref:Uncharacterized protein n=1 Tax=bioreactor metagenome TaxID=1076179 RepID=A0A645E3U9_9ZZZZ